MRPASASSRRPASAFSYHAGVYLRYIRMSVGLVSSSYTIRGFSWIGFQGACNKNHWTALNSSPMSRTTNSAHCDFWRKDKNWAEESKSKSNTTYCAFVTSIHVRKKSWSVVSFTPNQKSGKIAIVGWKIDMTNVSTPVVWTSVTDFNVIIIIMIQWWKLMKTHSIGSAQAPAEGTVSCTLRTCKPFVLGLLSFGSRSASD